MKILQIKKYSYYKDGLNPPSLSMTPLLPLICPSPPFYIFPEPPTFWQDFSDNIVSLKYQINTKIKSCDKVISSVLEDYKHQMLTFQKSMEIDFPQ